MRNDLTIAPRTRLRPNAPIRAGEIVTTRRIEFERRNGAWRINSQFFSPRHADAVPLLGSAERWTLVNESGGWWHPIHIHLEAHQVQRFNGRIPPFHRRFKVDRTSLAGNDVADVLIKFRTFTGPFVFHCHNVEHEDMRMMSAFDPRPAGEQSLLNGVREVPAEISGIPEGPEPALFFEDVGDVERLEGRGVGFADFEPGGETFPPSL